uniref:Ubiquitin-like domain-containing protein n=1 Tax=Monopterus albus TaxID=43700 RepID=A0A3Q3KNG1_MONAL
MGKINPFMWRRNEPHKKECPKWKSEYPMTAGQLRSKRDELWDTAPAFDGRKEIWDALRAAALAAECNDLELAQAIVDGACITLPHGMKLPTESYDEQGNSYQLPAHTYPLHADKNSSYGYTKYRETISELKKQLEEQEEIDVTRQRWFFAGKLLTDKIPRSSRTFCPCDCQYKPFSHD